MEKKKTFYEIDAAIMACVDAETGEIIDIDALNNLEMEREAKIENLVKWGKSLALELEGIEAEKKAFTDYITKRITTTENKIAGIKSTLVAVLDGQKWASADKVHKISYRPSSSVAFAEGFDWHDLPDGYLNVKITVAPNKIAIASAIKDGQQIDGCYLKAEPKIQLV